MRLKLRQMHRKQKNKLKIEFILDEGDRSIAIESEGGKGCIRGRWGKMSLVKAGQDRAR